MKFLILLLGIFLFWRSEPLCLDRFVVAEGETVVGEVFQHTVSENETLLDIARHYDLGYNQIELANPKVDPWLPPEGIQVVIPKMFVLPVAPFAGIVVNLPEMRLYFYREEGGELVVYTAPIGVGTEGKLTTEGLYTVYRKKERPYWFVPKSIREEDPSLPPVVPPGPDNPLGEYALYLSRGSYAIHGTNQPWGIGRRVSHGCIRLYPEDIKELFPLVPVGTPVKVIYQPYKIGIKGGEVYLQAFPDIEGKISEPLFEVTRLAAYLERKEGVDLWLDFTKLRDALRKTDGIPRVVGKVRRPLP